MREILIDTDVTLNVLLRETPFVETSAKVFLLLEHGFVHGYTAATTMTNVFYIARKRLGGEIAMTCVWNLLNTKGLDILSVDKTILVDAVESGMTDFEDAVQASVAKSAKLDLIVTRNLRDFKKSEIEAVTPEKFLSMMKSEYRDIKSEPEA